MLVYCDSVILMYYFDHVGSFQGRAANRLAAMAAADDQIPISDLVRLEYRIMPMKNADSTKLGAFDTFCSQPNVTMVPITSAVFERATRLRATHRFNLGDSIHLAAPIEASCSLFLTNDHRLSACTDIQVEVLP